MGRVRGVSRGIIRSNGRPQQIAARVLSLETVCGGYKRAYMSGPGVNDRQLAHRLVLEAFVGPCPSGMEACHNDNNPNNNSVENLRWDTPRGNTADKHKFGTFGIGEAASNSILTEPEVREIMARRGECFQRELAREYGVSVGTIADIHVGRTWSHLFTD